MTALSDNKLLSGIANNFFGEYDYLVGASKTIYNGGMVVLNASGYAEAATDATAKKLIGISRGESKRGCPITTTLSTTTAGTISVRVATKGIFNFAIASASQTDVGKNVYMLDDQTVGFASNYGMKVGKIVKIVSSTEVMVDLDIENKLKEVLFTLPIDHSVLTAASSDAMTELVIDNPCVIREIRYIADLAHTQSGSAVTFTFNCEKSNVNMTGTLTSTISAMATAGAFAEQDVTFNSTSILESATKLSIERTKTGGGVVKAALGNLQIIGYYL